MRNSLPPWLRCSLCVIALLALSTGCRGLRSHGAGNPHDSGPPPFIPKELSKVVLPLYVIEPPDILVIEALHIFPRDPYSMRTGDVVQLQVEGELDFAPLDGTYPIEPGGRLNLGSTYGAVRVGGMTTAQASEAIAAKLRSEGNLDTRVYVTLVEISGTQQIAGEHLVGPDGTVMLGAYGSLQVVGMTLNQAKYAIESHLSRFLDKPEVAVDVFAYNSKVYYVILEGAGLGDSVTRFPITGNETVLDAIANVNGLSELSSKRMWIARPCRDTGKVQILPVDWKAVTSQGSVATNYQVMPGDRVFIAENELVALDTGLGKLFSPFERIFGFSLLGVSTATRFTGRVLQGGGDQRQGGF